MIAVVSFVLLALLADSVMSQTYPKVRVELYYEALCPGCQEFITGALTNMLALDDMVAITDLKLVPYGNTKKNADGSFTCQHGADECTSDIYELCTMYKLAGNISAITTGESSYKAWPFIQCMETYEGNPAMAETCFTTKMASSGLSWSTVTACSAQEGSKVQNEAATATPKHDYVPWVLVDGAVLDNSDLVKAAVCKAYTGPAPASCKRLYKADALRTYA